MKSNSRLIIYSSLTFFMIAIYLWQWCSMPLYPDEVAYAILSTRLIYDHGVIHGLYAICESSEKIIPYFFYPAALLLSAIGSLPHWELIRAIPFVILALLSISVLYFGYSIREKKSAYNPLLLSAGFIGVSGSGMILMRPEIYLVLCGAILLFSYVACLKPEKSILKSALLWTALSLATLIVGYIHIQGLIFLPAILILLCRLSHNFNRPYSKVFRLLSISLILMTIYYSYVINLTFSCINSPLITKFVSQMTLPGVVNDSTIPLMDKIKEHFVLYDKISFRSPFQIEYLPKINIENHKIHRLFSRMNTGITYLCHTILYSFIALCAYLTLSLLVRVAQYIYRRGRILAGLISALESDFMILYSLCLGHFALFIYDVQLNFYRVFYLNLAMTILLIIAISTVRYKLFRIITLGVGCFAATLCIASTLMTNMTIRHELENGYKGPSTPLANDWEKTQETVNTLKEKCHIADNTSKIIIEDLTYDALKHHPNIYPVTYLMLASETNKVPYQQVISQVNPNAAIIRCGFFELFQIAYQAKIGNLCCINFQASHSRHNLTN